MNDYKKNEKEYHTASHYFYSASNSYSVMYILALFALIGVIFGAIIIWATTKSFPYYMIGACLASLWMIFYAKAKGEHEDGMGKLAEDVEKIRSEQGKEDK